jgi:hypothetical protein
MAESLATTEGHCGAIAFSRTGDPALGDFEDAVILKAVGEVDSGLLAGQKALPAKRTPPRVSAHSGVATRTNSCRRRKPRYPCFIVGKGRRGVGRPWSRRSPAVNEVSGKPLKLQSAPSSKGLTKLDET